MNGIILAGITAAWLGILCSISPCPLTANIAAISFVSRRVGVPGKVLLAGCLYAFGRVLAYTALGSLLVGGLTAAPELSYVLQKYMNLLMGPLLIITSMVLLGLLKLPFGSGTAIHANMERWGVFSALPLGILFALSFCPTSAALFFGSLLPIAVKMRSGVFLPGCFGLGTGLPVLVSAFVIAFSANRIGVFYGKLVQFETWAQRVTGICFLLAGCILTVKILLR